VPFGGRKINGRRKESKGGIVKEKRKAGNRESSFAKGSGGQERKRGSKRRRKGARARRKDPDF
jgi:hypothetical protein